MTASCLHDKPVGHGSSPVLGQAQAGRLTLIFLVVFPVLAQPGNTELFGTVQRSDAVSTIDMELLDGGMQTFTTQQGMLFDSRSFLHLVSTTTLAALAALHGAATGGAVRRYRPNILI